MPVRWRRSALRGRPVGSERGIDLEGDLHLGHAGHLRSTRAAAASFSASGTSNTSSSWTVRIIWVSRPSASMARSTLIIASFMMSAADPWIGALSAWRSPIGSHARVAAAELGQIAAPPEHRRREPVGMSLVDDLVEEVGDTPELLEVGVHDLLGLRHRDVEAVGEARGPHPVSEPVVHHLRGRPVLRRELGWVDTEDAGRRRRCARPLRS